MVVYVGNVPPNHLPLKVGWMVRYLMGPNGLGNPTSVMMPEVPRTTVEVVSC